MSPTRSPLCVLWACVACALISCVPGLGCAEIRVLGDPEPSAESIALVQQLRDALSIASPNIFSGDVTVTVGAAAFAKEIAAGHGKPIVATYLTSADFEQVLRGQSPPVAVTAVFENPDPRDQLSLARALLGETATIGVFDVPRARSMLTRLDPRRVRMIPVAPGQRIDAILRETDSIDAILVLPDGVLTRANINHTVRALYARHAVLIGHSATLARVGALASVYVTPESIAGTVAQVIAAYAGSGKWPPPQYVEDIDIAVNERLARSLNMVPPSRERLLRSIIASRR